MTVKLIAITKPVIEECSTASELIAYTARVSNPDNQANHLTAPKLLKYLMDNQHWSPFEMAHIVIEIKTTRDIARQILRHRSFSFQEFSQRYAAVSDDWEVAETRMQDSKNRQSSHETSNVDLKDAWQREQSDVMEIARQAYLWALENGIAKEVARKVLPEGLTPSTLYMSGTVRSFIHYCEERTKLATQKEHRLIAEGVKLLLLENFPELKPHPSGFPTIDHNF